MERRRFAAGAQNMSEEKVITFALTNLRPFREGRTYRLGLLDLTVEIYPTR